MPLHGKVVVIKRSGVDGTEFPLTAACVFGRKAECDIRIQLPQVSKEHCKIDLNENKEVIITNLSSVNPTRINGEVLQQSERLKHGDVITIFDRSFRFEYPPEPTPKKKRASTGGKTETLRVLQDKQAGDTAAADADKTSETPLYPCLKDGANNDNIQRTPEKTAEVESTDSPFGDLYQMIKKTLDTKSPWKPSGSQPQTPATRFCTPQAVSVRKVAGEVTTLPKAEGCTPMQVKAEETFGKTEDNSSDCGAEEKLPTEPATPVQETPKHKRLSLTSKTPTTVATLSPQKKHQATPADQMIEQGSAETPTMTPTRRKSKLATPIKTAVTEVQDQTEALPEVSSTPKSNPSPRHSPRTAEKKRQAQVATPSKPAATEKQDQAMVTEALPSTPKTNATPRQSPRTAEKKQKAQDATPTKPAATEMQDQAMVTEVSTPKTNASPRHSSRSAEKKRQAQEVAETAATVNVTATKKRKSEELGAGLTMPQMKRKRVSFGGHLSPELFDKRLPPDSPLRKGAAPRRSLCVPKLTKSLLRRASVGVLPKAKTPSPTKKSLLAKTPSPAKKSPKAKTPSPAKKSPKAKTPSPAKKSPKAKTPSPAKKSPKAKTPSPAKKSPKAKTPSPAKKSPKAKTPSPAKKSPKAQTPSPAKKSPKAKTPSPVAAKKSPKAKTPSPAKKSLKAKTPSPVTKSPKAKTPSPAKKSPKVKSPSLLETPTVQGRFSVSRISTPSPVAEETISAPEPSAPMTPKLPLRRKSMKSTSRKSNTMAKNLVEVMRRRSGVSRASLKAQNSWADIVKFGQTKSQVVVPEAKKASVQMKKKTVQPKHKTPAKNFKNYIASTGHADSPVSIVVGRAHKRHVQPTGAAPRLVHNIVLQKNMKMDEDLTGVAEIFNTPVATKQRKSSVVSVHQSATKTPVSTSVIEASVMNTPEETGEMMVSPLAVASSTKSGKYNHEAVERLFLDDDNSFVSEDEVPVDDINEHQCPDVETKMTTTPQQKPPHPDCLTGVKRLLKTPKQKPEPVEDLRGKLLKTPKQKSEQVECLTGVKRIMRTPRQKAEPVEDIRGKLLMTPKPETPEQVECLTGVKRIMRTPRQKAEPVEDIRGKLLMTPKFEKPEQAECLSGVKRMMKTPKQKAEPVVDLSEELLKTPKAPMALEEVSVGDTRELLETPVHKDCLEDLAALTNATPNVKSSLDVVESLMKTPKEQLEPAAGLMKTPKQMEEPIERQRKEDLEKLTEEPLTNDCVQMATIEGHDELQPQIESDESQEPEVETVVPVSADNVGVVKDIPVEDENNSDEQQATQQPVTEPVETDASQEPEVETSVPVSADDAEVVPEITIEAENKTSLPAEDDQQSSQHPTTVVETNASQEPEVETVVPVSADNVGVVKDIPVEDENNTPLPAEDEQQTTQQPTTVPVETDASQEPKIETRDPDVEMVKEIPVEDENNTPLPVEDEQQASQQPTTVPVETDASQAHEEAIVVIPAEKPRRGGRKIKQDTKSQMAPESAEALEPQPNVTTEKPRRGGRAKARTVVKEDVVSKDEPAKEDVPEENLDDVQTATEESEVPLLKTRGRGRKAKQDSQESSTEPEVEPIVSGDVAEVVEKIAVEAENNTSLPADDHQLGDAQSSTAIEEREVPVLKTRGRGRKAKQDSQESSTEPEIVPVSGDAAEAVQEIPVETENKTILPAEDGQQVGDAHSTTATEEREMPVPKARGRGRKAKVAETLEAHEEAVPAEKPRRGGRKIELEEEPTLTSAAEKTEVPVLKTRGRGRKAKQDLPEAVEIEEVQKEAVIPVEEAAAIPAEKPRRGGRKTKQDSVESQEEAVVIPPEEAADIPAEKPRRGGRKTKQDSVESQEEAVVIPPEEAVDIPAEKPRRGGRKIKQDSVESQEASEEAADIPAEKPRRGGRKIKQDSVESQEAPEEAAIISVEEAADIPAEKPRRGGRNTKQDAQVVAPPESTEPQDVQLAMPTEKPKRGARGKTVIKEVEILSKAEPAMEDVSEENLDGQSSTAIEEKEKPVLKTRGRGRTSKQELTEAETLPAEKPKRGRKKGSAMNEEALVKEVIVSEEPEEKLDEHTQDDVQEENTGHVETAATPTAITKSETPVLKTRGRKAKQDLPEAVETEEAHEEVIIPAEKPKRGGRKIKEVEIVSEEPEENPEPAQDVEEEKSSNAPVKARKGRKLNSADDDSQATPTKRARRGEIQPSLQEAEVVETAVPVTKSATRGRGKPKEADSKTKLSAGPVRKGRKATTPADDRAVAPSTEEVIEEVQEEPHSKKSVMWKDDLTETHVISPAVKAVRGRKPKLADNVPSPTPSPVKRDQSVESTECPTPEGTALTKTGSKRKAPRNMSKSQEEDLSNETVPSEPIKSRGKRVKATDAAVVEIVTPATEVPETKPRRGRAAKK